MEYAAFVPNILLDKIVIPTTRNSTDYFVKDVMIHESNLNGITAICDISGFTRLAEAQCKAGAKGTEILTTVVNLYFQMLISKTEEFDGDVIKFAGDALLCFWQVTDQDTLEDQGYKATLCCLKMLQALHDIHKEVSEETHKLSLHVGLGFGETTFLVVGGFKGKYEFLLTGTSIADAGPALVAAEKGEIVVRKNIFESIKSNVSDHVEKNLDCFQIKALIERRKSSIEDLFDKRSINESPTNSDKGKVNIRKKISKATDLQIQLTDSLQHFLPKPVIIYLRSIKDANSSINEIRQTTVMFCKIENETVLNTTNTPGSPDSTNTSSLSTVKVRAITSFHEVRNASDKKKKSTAKTKSQNVLTTSLQVVFLALQKVNADFGGMVRQLIVDDKGLVLILAYGIMQHSYPDNASRAINCSLGICSLLMDMRIQSYIGIATGQVFCGTVGSKERKELALVGDSVNLSARLMNVAHEPNIFCASIICDEATMSQSQSDFNFNFLQPVKVKGKSDLIDIYTPSPKDKGKVLRGAKGLKLIGRDDQYSVIFKSIQGVTKSKVPACVIVKGEVCSGKSMFMRYVRNKVMEDIQSELGPFAILTTIALEEEISTSYFVFRQIVSQILGLSTLLFRTMSTENRVKFITFQLKQLKLDKCFQILNKGETIATKLQESPMGNGRKSLPQKPPADMKLTKTDRAENKRMSMPSISSKLIIPLAKANAVRDSISIVQSSSKITPTFVEEEKEDSVIRPSSPTRSGSASKTSRLSTMPLQQFNSHNKIDEATTSSPLIPIKNRLPSEKITKQGSHKRAATNEGLINSDNEFDSPSHSNTPKDADSEEAESENNYKLNSAVNISRMVALLQFLCDEDYNTPIHSVFSTIPSSFRGNMLLHFIDALVSQAAPAVILIEDAQYMDELSFLLLKRLLSYPKNELLIVLSVNTGTDVKSHVKSFFDNVKPKEVIMSKFTIQNVRELILSKLGNDLIELKDIPDSLVKLVYDHAGGEPLWSLELIGTLKTNKAFYIQNDKIIIDEEMISDLLNHNAVTETSRNNSSGSSENPADEYKSFSKTKKEVRSSLVQSSINLQYTGLKGLLLQRFDQLPQTHQTVLKAASVIGSAFSLDLLKELLPLSLRRDLTQIDEIIELCIEKQFLRSGSLHADMGFMEHNYASNSPSFVYEFDSNAIRLCIYSLIPFTSKQLMHRAIARNYEKAFCDDMDSVFPIVAHHCSLAQDYDKSFKCYERASRNAGLNGLKEKSLEYLLKALQLAPVCSFLDYENFNDLRLMNWRMDAYDLLREFGRLEEANIEYEAAKSVMKGDTWFLEHRKEEKIVTAKYQSILNKEKDKLKGGSSSGKKEDSKNKNCCCTVM